MLPKITTDERVRAVLPHGSRIFFELFDGRLLAIPLEWYPRLRAASREQLNHWEITGAGFAVHWPELDEDLEISGLLAGHPSPNVRPNVAITPERIRSYRESSGISQSALAEILGVRQATISDWEKGKSTPSRLAATRLGELIRKQELSRVDSEQDITSLDEGHLTSCLDGSIAFTVGESRGYGGDYHFTELGKIVPVTKAHDAPSSCARFNPSRQFMYACSFGLSR